MSGTDTGDTATPAAARGWMVPAALAFALSLAILVAYACLSGCVGTLRQIANLGTLAQISVNALIAPFVPAVLIVSYVRVTLAAATILLAAVAAGSLLLRACRLWPQSSWEKGLFAAAVGLGVISAVTLGLGLLGLLHRWLLGGLMLVLIVGAYRELLRLGRSVLSHLSSHWKARKLSTALWLIILFFFLMNLTRAFEPPWEYDVQEYHLGAPARYHAAGHIRFLSDNVYASFPQNVEMIHLLAMRLTGSPDRGAAAGKLVWVVVGFLGALALRRLGEHLFNTEAGNAAAVIFYLWPSISVYAGVAYVEIGLTFYFVMTAWAFVRYARPGAQPSLSSIRWLAVAGIMAGLAAGCKYPAVLFLIVPACGALVATRLRNSKALARCLAIFLVTAACAFLPWLLRNSAYTGNPTYPLLYKVFGGSNWDLIKDARWTHAHAPGAMTPAAMVRSMGGFLFGNSHESATLLPLLFVPFVLLCRKSWRRRAGAIVAYAVVYSLLWFFFTHRIDRFLCPILPFLALVSGAGFAALRSRGTRSFAAWVLVVLSLAEPARIINYAQWDRSADVFLGGAAPAEFFENSDRTGFQHGYRAMQLINELAQRRRVNVLFIGEARTFYCRTGFRSSTVFDTHLLEGARTPQEVLQKLRRHGITHILVNTAELKRLQESYRFSYNGREHLGMLDGFQWRHFAALIPDHVGLVRTFAGGNVDAFQWENWNAFRNWCVREERAGRKAGGLFIALYEVKPPQKRNKPGTNVRSSDAEGVGNE